VLGANPKADGKKERAEVANASFIISIDSVQNFKVIWFLTEIVPVCSRVFMRILELLPINRYKNSTTTTK
jgi:hypothetical protein